MKTGIRKLAKQYIQIGMVVVLAVMPEITYATNTEREASAVSSTERLIVALIEVESHGDDYVIGDKRMKNKAYGCLQIRKPCVDDVNQRLGSQYSPKDMLGNRSLSTLVCKTYLARYATRARLGREPTLEDKARIWNGGPNGWRKQETLGYWSGVQKELAKLK